MQYTQPQPNMTLEDYLTQFADPELDREFVPPTTPTELLERGLVMAEQEDKWIKNAWLQPTVNRTPQVCGDVQACAMGLLVLARADGPLVRAYYGRNVWPQPNLRTISETDPLIRAAASYLVMGLNDAQGEGLRRWRGEEEAVHEVLLINDSPETTSDLIVRGFRRAVQMSAVELGE